MFAVYRDAGLPVVLHSDGDISDILPDLINIGLTCLNPCQPEVLDHEELASEYGHSIAFYGRVSTQQTLPLSTPKEVRGACESVLQMLGRERTGLVFGPSHGDSGATYRRRTCASSLRSFTRLERTMYDGEALEPLRGEFSVVYNRRPEFAVRAPGRVDLMGSHTDYNEGYVMTMAIDRETVVLVASTSCESGVFPSGADLLVDTDVPIGGELRSSEYGTRRAEREEAAAVLKERMDAVRLLFLGSFAGARELFEIVVPAMEAMHDAMLRAPGCTGARQAGAGFGGCMIAAAETPAREAFVRSVVSGYRAETGIEARAYLVNAVAGASLTTGVLR